MEIRRLSIRDFRSHASAGFTFAPGPNLLHGLNGAGKTNVLEAIHFLCLGRSFLTANDRLAVRIGADAFQVEADVHLDRRGPTRVRIAFVPGEGKRIEVGGAPLDRLVDVVGRFPVVVIAPSDQRLTEDGPDERRRFLDALLCQASSAYLDDLLAYRRMLRQRNHLLAGRPARDLLGSFDAGLIARGSRVVARRSVFLQGFADHLRSAFAHLERGTEQPTIRYRSSAGLGDDHPDADTVAERYARALHERREQELERGLTLVGPHRDDLEFLLDGRSVRRYASQGQHRTFVIGLKLAQYQYLSEQTGERPLLLLDDVFDTLDPDRVRIFSQMLSGPTMAQSIVTAARGDLFDHAHPDRFHTIAVTAAAPAHQP